MRNRASVLRVCWIGPSESPVIFNIKCCSELFRELNFGEKSGFKIYWILTNPCKYHVHQTWIRRVFLTPIVGSAIHQFGSCLRQQVAIMALITPLPATQVQHDIFVLPCFCLQIARHNFLAKFHREVNLPCVHLEYAQPATTHTSHPHAFAVVAERDMQSVSEVTWKKCRA